MATTKRGHVFATCIISGIAAIFTIISLATEQWIVSNSIVSVEIDDGLKNTVRYGLFQGTFFQLTAGEVTYQLSMTCSLKENICAVLCYGDEEVLRRLYQGTENETNRTPMGRCPELRKTTSLRHRPVYSYRKTESTDNKKFINYGVWVSTIIFLVISLAFGVLSSALSMFNTINNPVQVFLSIQGLYIYNALALCGSVMAMALWGVMHTMITYHNVAIYYTLIGTMKSDKVAYLGFSYWINIIPIVCYFGSVTVLYIRQYQLSKDPGQKIVHREDNADPVIYLF